MSTAAQRPERLPESWINRLFEQMQGYYGARWLRLWIVGQVGPDGQDLGLVNAKAVWAEKLAPWHNKPETIKNALNHLPPEPPSLPQFLDLLRGFAESKQPALPYIMTKEEKAQAKERLKEILDKVKL